MLQSKRVAPAPPIPDPGQQACALCLLRSSPKAPRRSVASVSAPAGKEQSRKVHEAGAAVPPTATAAEPVHRRWKRCGAARVAPASILTSSYGIRAGSQHGGPAFSSRRLLEG